MARIAFAAGTGGMTWELGCRSTNAGRAEIDAACADMVRSLGITS